MFNAFYAIDLFVYPLKTFHAIDLFVHPAKKSENFWFSEVFRDCRKTPVV